MSETVTIGAAASVHREYNLSICSSRIYTVHLKRSHCVLLYLSSKIKFVNLKRYSRVPPYLLIEDTIYKPGAVPFGAAASVY